MIFRINSLPKREAAMPKACWGNPGWAGYLRSSWLRDCLKRKGRTTGLRRGCNSGGNVPEVV